ncbi:SRPBCC family protein [Streptomyces smyrnaeus]|uniref:SRPBCC family protein n=1 Tax=Streptomyces smyrnaeus TaxID=1387713 RepID=UPI0033E9CD74
MTTPEPVRRSVTVPADINRAFAAFVDGIDSWWPVQNSITRAPQARVTIEPRVGGRWYEESVDGEQCDWGKVLTWDPPHRLVLAWQLQTAIPGITGGGLCHGFWRFEPGMRTEVELRFTTLGPRRTKVDLEHRHLDRFVHPEHARSYLDNDGGWPELLDRYTRAATTL